MKTANKIAMVVFSAMVLMTTACSKTSNGSAPAAATPSNTATCTLQNGQYLNQNGQPCTPTQTVCPANGQYTYNNQVYSCTPGQVITGYPTNPNYPYPSNPQNGCSSYYQIYGQVYVPMYYYGQLVCVNYNALISALQSSYQYYQTPYYQYGPSYYYYNPPYSSGGGNSCNFGAAIQLQNFGAAFCFN